ncbi:MAG: 4'-phosphopantetheinyl transferase superfamily protein [Alkalispirochaeta sp.]
MFLGNDLVHWSGTAAREKETRTSRTQRFVDRVLHPQEHRLIAGLGVIRNRLAAVPLPHAHALWALWAAKEATFKAAVKAWPGLAFSPRSIRIEFLPRVPGHGGSERAWPLAQHLDSDHQITAMRPLARGLAHIRDHVYEILWEYHDEVVHAIAMGPFSQVRTDRHAQQHGDHWNGIVRMITRIPSHRASQAVRSIARHLLSVLPVPSLSGLPGRHVGIVRELLETGRLGPPTFHDGAPREDLDLTLTHDGPWGAAGILHRPAPAHCPH